MEREKRIWFGPKKLGYGIAPVSVEGWVVTIVFLAVGIAWQRLLGRQPPYSYGPIGLIAIYAGIVWLTYGRPED